MTKATGIGKRFSFRRFPHHKFAAMIPTRQRIRGYGQVRTRIVLELLHFPDFVIQGQSFCRQQVFSSGVIGLVWI